MASKTDKKASTQLGGRDPSCCAASTRSSSSPGPSRTAWWRCIAAADLLASLYTGPTGTRRSVSGRRGSAPTTTSRRSTGTSARTCGAAWEPWQVRRASSARPPPDRRPGRHPALRQARPRLLQPASHIGRTSVPPGCASRRSTGARQGALGVLRRRGRPRRRLPRGVVDRERAELPNVFVIEPDTKYAYSTPLRLTSNWSFAIKAVAYGIPGVTVDGTGRAGGARLAQSRRDSSGPAPATARDRRGRDDVRMHGHAEHDPADYVVKELLVEHGGSTVELFENVCSRAVCSTTTR